MIGLPAGIAAHVDDDVYSAAHLIEVTGDHPHYWTDFVMDLVWNGHTWLHDMPFTVGQIVSDANGIQDVSITFDEQRQQLQGYDANEGTADRNMRIHEAWIDTTTNPPSVYVDGVMTDLAEGETSGLDFDETDQNSTGTLSLGSSSAMTTQNGPRNEYNLDCVNGYRDARCKYAGALPTCKRTYEDCGAHANTPNFRGCRHALTPGTTINWGAGSYRL